MHAEAQMDLEALRRSADSACRKRDARAGRLRRGKVRAQRAQRQRLDDREAVVPIRYVGRSQLSGRV